jgi:hypothetical protein
MARILPDLPGRIQKNLWANAQTPTAGEAHMKDLK